MFYKILDGSEKSIFRYKDLIVFDANGKYLPAKMFISEIRGQKILSIETDDANAVYPITIDPLATAPEWLVIGDQSLSRLGFSARYAGDVNNDGFDDIVAGAFGYNSGSSYEGKAFLYLGSASGPSTTAVWTAESNQASAYFGHCVSSAGDVNNDGYDDVIIGSVYWTNAHTNEGKVFLYLGNATGLNTTAAWTYEPNQAYANAGSVINFAGDVNNDGFDDIIIGMSQFNGAFADGGRLLVFYGSVSGLPLTPSWIYDGDQLTGELGVTVKYAGDINNDGYDDIIAGARQYDNGSTNEGRASGLPLTPSWIVESNQTNAYFGQAVSGAGDINNDGYDDVLVGAPFYDKFGLTDNGAVFIYYGSASGLSIIADDSLYGYYTNDNFGVRISNGDINHDLYGDILISTAKFNAATEGITYLYIGNTFGLNNYHYWSFRTTVSTFEYDTGLDGDGDTDGDGFDDILIGEAIAASSAGQLQLFYGNEITPLLIPDFNESMDQTSSNFGFAVSGGGDINNDGFDDIVVSAPYFDAGSLDEGKVFCYLGNASGLDTIHSSSAEGNQISALFGSSVEIIKDYNADGFDDLIIGAPLFDHTLIDEGRVYLFKGKSTGINFLPIKIYDGGQTSCKMGSDISSGDINGDGLTDVCFSAPYFDEGFTDQGKAWIYINSISGFGTTPFFTKTGSQMNSNFGFSLDLTGDINGDGHGDIIIGEPGFDNAFSNSGKTYLFFGNVLIMDAIADWTYEGGQTESKLGYSVSDAGDINQDGFHDVIVGQPLYDNGSTDEGRILLFNGNNTGLNLIPNWTSEPNIISAQYGFSVKDIGDINGDDYPDFMTGAIKNEYTITDEGSVDIFFGSRMGMEKYPNGYLKGGQTNSQFGFSISGAGDLNGDGFADIVIGAPYYDKTFTDAGRAFILFGENATCNSEISDVTLIPEDTNIQLHFEDEWAVRRYDLRWKKEYESIWFYDSTSLNDYTFSLLEPCTGYDLQMQKVCIGGGSEWIDLGTVISTGCPVSCADYPITGITVSSITKNTAFIDWNNAGDIYSYQIQIRKTGEMDWSISDVFYDEYLLIDLDSCTNYEMQIRSNCFFEFGSWSTILNFTTIGECVPSCSIPSGLFVNNITTISAKLNWDPVAGATKYKVSYRPIGGSWVNVNATSTNKTITGLTAGTNYEFKVKTICGALSSAFSASTFFSTLLRTSELEPNEIVVQIMPNPNEGIFKLTLGNINSENILIEIYEITGQLIFNKEFTYFHYSTGLTINISDSPSGIYKLVVKSNSEIITKSFVLN